MRPEEAQAKARLSRKEIQVAAEIDEYRLEMERARKGFKGEEETLEREETKADCMQVWVTRLLISMSRILLACFTVRVHIFVQVLHGLSVL